MRDLYRLTFVLGDLRGPSNLGPEQLEVLLRALVQTNVLRLQGSRARPSLPAFSPWPTGAKPAGHEEWQDAASVMQQGRGNAASLVCLRVAELQLRGVPASAVVGSRGKEWRAALEMPDGSRPDLLPVGQGWRTLEDRERITFCLDLFNGSGVSERTTQATLDTLLGALQEIDQNFLLAHPEAPPLYSLGEHLLYMEEPVGQEDWQDVPTCLRMLLSDCLPLSTLILRDDYTFAPIADVKIGDRIMGDGDFTTVLDGAVTGEKSILALGLDNGCVLKVSPEHRVFTSDGREIRARDVRVGQRLRTPSKAFPCLDGFRPDSRLTDGDIAWLIGTYIADGWHNFYRRKSADGGTEKVPNGFSISGYDLKPKRRKIEQKERVRALCEALGIKHRWYLKAISVHDGSLAKIMAACGSHAPVKKLSSMSWSLEQVRELVSGLQTDCSTATAGTLTHGTTSPDLALQLRVLYRMLNQSVHIREWTPEQHRGLGQHSMYRVGVRRHAQENWSKGWKTRADILRTSVTVRRISRQKKELCCDITTDSGRFYLPESDTIVHNCEDLAAWRAAESVVRQGVPARAISSKHAQPGGGTLYHITTRFAGGRTEDPSKIQGMR